MGLSLRAFLLSAPEGGLVMVRDPQTRDPLSFAVYALYAPGVTTPINEMSLGHILRCL